MDNKEKGDYQGQCNVTRCESSEPATWFNHSTRKYYCRSCAHRLNSDPFNKKYAEKRYGHDLLTAR